VLFARALCRLDGDRMAHVSACSLLALLASRVRRVTFSARSTWLSVVLSARSACLPLHAARGLHSRVSRCSSAFADSASRPFHSAFAITRLGRCSLCLRDYASRPLLFAFAGFASRPSLPSRVSRLGPLCLRGFRVSAIVHTFSVAHPLCFDSFASRPFAHL